MTEEKTKEYLSIQQNKLELGEYNQTISKLWFLPKNSQKSVALFKILC